MFACARHAAALHQVDIEVAIAVEVRQGDAASDDLRQQVPAGES